MLTLQFSESEILKIEKALSTLEESFTGKLLTDQSQNSENIEDLSSAPENPELEFMPAFEDINHWDINEKYREVLNPIALRLKNIASQVLHTNRALLHNCWTSKNKY